MVASAVHCTDAKLCAHHKLTTRLTIPFEPPRCLVKEHLSQNQISRFPDCAKNLAAMASAQPSNLDVLISMLCITGQPGPEGLDRDSHRRSSAKGWYSKGQSETAFSDAFPFLVTSQVRLA